MRAVRYHSGGDPDVLQLDEIDRPSADHGELLVDVRAASINPVDAKRRQSGAGQLPKTTGSDFAGEVVGVGSGVSGFAEGDRVFGTGLHADRFQQGSFAESVAVPVDIVAPLPDSVSYEVGAGVALVGVTAWRALVDHTGVRPAESCFIHGGSGGVGHVAVQLAREMGGDVVATAGSSDAQTRVRELGASEVFDYDRADLKDAVIEATGGGADVVVDHMVGEYLPFDVAVASFGGRIVVYGGNEGALPDARAPRGKELAMYWMSMSNAVNRKGTLPSIRSILTELAVLLERETLTADIARTYDLDEAAEMHRAVLEDSFIGKLVLTL